MSRILVTPLLLVAATVFFASPVSFAQNSAHGHWVYDPKNIATPGFVYDIPPAGFDPVTASDNELKQWGFPPRPCHCLLHGGVPPERRLDCAGFDAEAANLYLLVRPPPKLDCLSGAKRATSLVRYIRPPAASKGLGTNRSAVIAGFAA